MGSLKDTLLSSVCFAPDTLGEGGQCWGPTGGSVSFTLAPLGSPMEPQGSPLGAMGSPRGRPWGPWAPPWCSMGRPWAPWARPSGPQGSPLISIGGPMDTIREPWGSIGEPIGSGWVCFGPAWVCFGSGWVCFGFAFGLVWGFLWFVSGAIEINMGRHRLLTGPSRKPVQNLAATSLRRFIKGAFGTPPP